MILRSFNYLMAVLLVCLVGCVNQSKVTPLAEKGVLDLTNWDFEQDGPVNLNGEYEFYWNQLLMPQEFIQHSASLNTAFISVPKLWNNFEYQGKPVGGHGYATYRLIILLNRTKTPLAIKSGDVATSFDLFINGQKSFSAGVVGKTPESAKPGYYPAITGFQSNKDSVEVIYHISNFSHQRGGAKEKIVLGTRDQLQKQRELKITYDLFLFGGILIMGLYHLGLFSLMGNDRSPLFFGLFCLMIALRMMSTGERYILFFFPNIGYEVMLKLEYLSFYLAVPAFIQFFDSLFAARFLKAVCMISTAIGLVFCALVIFSPPNFFSGTAAPYEAFTIIMCSYAMGVLVSAAFKKERKAIVFLFGFSVLFLLAINDILYNQGMIHTNYMVHSGLFVFIFSQAYQLSRNFSNAFIIIKNQREELKKAEASLKKTNKGLEKKIQESTAEILKTNEILRREIEERKQAQQITREAKKAAEIANRSKSEFLANMSHELRTPLNHILGFTELILDKHFGELNEVQEEYLTDVYASSTHLLSLINDILDLSKIETGKIDYKPTEVDIRKVLADSLIMIKEKAMKNQIQLATRLEDLPESFFADERCLKQILYNLLSNAVKFTPEGGRIELSANRLSGCIQISIQDNGIGLKKETLKKIFLPFEQVENSSNRRFQGTGLGLALTKTLVELHRGRIWAESEGEGLGAIFNFILPEKGLKRH